MKSFYFTSNSLREPTIGKIFSIVKGKNGFTVNGKTISSNEAGFYFLVKNNQLQSGDIVLLEPSGKGSLLYEKASISNALFLTEQCNSQCLMCPQPPRVDKENNIQLALDIIPMIDNDIKVLGITGGEPTLVRDGLVKVLKKCKKYLPDTMIQLLTNGRALKDFKFVEDMFNVLGSKLYVCIPLYADNHIIHDEIVGKQGAFFETIEGLYNLARLTIPTEIRTVIVKPNYQRLPAWSDFIYRTVPFIDHVAFMGLEPYGLALDNINQVWVDPITYSDYLESGTKLLAQRGINFSIYNHQLCTLNEHLWEFSAKTISEWKNVYLEECDNCDLIESCGGFFESSKIIKSKGIHPIAIDN